MVDLRECPFCGKTPILFGDGTIDCSNEDCQVNPGLWPVAHISGTMASEKVKQKQIEIWNTRASDAAIKELVDSLEKLKIGSCTCLTKTPDVEYHSDECRYRIICQIIAKYKPQES